MSLEAGLTLLELGPTGLSIVPEFSWVVHTLLTWLELVKVRSQQDKHLFVDGN